MKMNKVIFMAVMLLFSISANAWAVVDFEATGDTVYSTADLSMELMYNVDIDPVVLDSIDYQVKPIAEPRHSAARARLKAKTAKLPTPPSNYRQRYEVGWHG